MLKHSDFLTQAPSAPNDPELASGDRLVDRRFLRACIRELVGDALRLEDADIRFDAVRYKPGARVTVTVSVPAPDGASRRRFTFRAFRRGESTAAFEKLLGRHVPESAVRHFDVNDTVLLAYPFDYELRGLRKLVEGKDGATYLRRLLPELATSETRLRSYSLRHTLLRYKPERHAVVRIDFRVQDQASGDKRARSILARVYPPDAVPAGAKSCEGAHTPELLAVDTERGVVLEAFVPGTSLGERLRSGAPSALVDLERVGSALAVFHGGHRTSDAFVADVTSRRNERLARTAQTLAEADPTLAEPVRALADRLRSDIAEHLGPLVRAHRDLHPGQVLCDETRVWLVDTEKSDLDSAASDLGTLAFFMDAQSDGVTTSSELDALLRGYASVAGWAPSDPQLLFWKSVAAFERATAPLRNLHPLRRTWSRAYVDRSNAYAVESKPVSTHNACSDRNALPLDRLSGELQ